MFVRLLEAKYIGGHRAWLRFSDGSEGEVDLLPHLWGPVFEPLRDPAAFARFAVRGTLCWPNGADFAPEFLLGLITSTAAKGSVAPAP